MSDNLVNREEDNLIQYISCIEFSRVSLAKLNELKILLKTNNSVAIQNFLETRDYEQEKAHRIMTYYPSLKYSTYTRFRNTAIYTHYGLLGNLLNNQKDYFPKEKRSLLELNQLSLFSDKPSKFKIEEEIDLPIIALIGQTKNYLHNNFKGVNYLDYNNIKRIHTLLTKSQLTNLDKFITELRKISTKEYRSFLDVYYRINEKTANNENIEDEIWAISDDKWFKFKNEIREFNNFFHDVRSLRNFFAECLKFRKDFVIIQHHYHYD